VIEFKNEPFTNFAESTNKSAMEQAIKRVQSEYGRTYSLHIDGKDITSSRVATSIDPSSPTTVIGHVVEATTTDVDTAFTAAERAFETWSRKSFAERSRYLYKMAAIMRRRKMELSAWMVVEAGKTWAEADGDTAEAIDFLEYYAREAVKLGTPKPLIPYENEENDMMYLPLGVGIIITPWNFPLAILTGMTTSAIVTGNTVLLKPAAQTPIIGAKFMEVAREAGVPDGVINFVPGNPKEIGDYMTQSPRTRFISFTGSMGVGKHIHEVASSVKPGQRWLKRVVAEMGGKDAIVVGEGSDIEWAAMEIVRASFGFSGQKCSACSRVIAVDAVYDAVETRVVELTKALQLGKCQDGATQVGPVIDQTAFDKVKTYVEIGKTEGKLLTGGTPATQFGYTWEPTIFGDVKRDARVAREEIFGPVVAMIRARDFKDAIDIANDTEFGLTGSVFSGNRDELEYARREFQVGNLYINRKCTGALVGVQPFGGFNLSGTDSKAGGPDYLLQFTQPKVVAERF
jgi:1-pyrroline-5-carboxylate dehydrogenase